MKSGRSSILAQDVCVGLKAVELDYPLEN